jgi:hypothetical protein
MTMPGDKKTRGTEKQNVTVHRAGPKSQKSEPEETRGDRNVIRRVSRGGIAIQGDYNEVQISQITQVFQTAPPSVEEEQELTRLKDSIPQALANLKAAMRATKPVGGNPYHLLEALDISEQDQLGGRNATIQLLMGKLQSGVFAILVGENGIGKTSLLRAGLIPAYVNAGHWPVWIEASKDPLDVTIKKHVLGSLNDFPALARRPLKDVLRLSAAFLTQESEIILLLDNMEVFFQQESQAQQTFADLWKECVNETGLPVRWLFSTVDVKHHLNRFQSGEKNPFANLVALPPLDPAGARDAILAPTRAANIHVDEPLLDALLHDLGNEVDPTRLQIVCHTLAGGNIALNKTWNLADYEKLGRADGILRAYLDDAILELPPSDRDPAWQVLSILERDENRAVPTGQIKNQLSSIGFQKVKLDPLLETLRIKHLVAPAEEGYVLASESMGTRIREWREQEAIPKQIQKEAARQLEQIRNSVLRGLIGGAIGLGLFRWIVGGLPLNVLTGAIQPLEATFLTLLYAMVGGLIGLLLMFSVDISSAMKMRLWLRYLIGGLGGAIAFGLALALFVYLSIASDAPLQNALSSALEGGLWGLVAGMGITWGMLTKRPAWLVFLAIPLLSGIVLVLADGLLTVLTRSQPLQIAVGGWVFPFFIIIGARLGRRVGGHS